MIVECVPGNNNQNDPGKDLALMSSCDHLILSYGTFGMMAAWFNNHGTTLESSEKQMKFDLMIATEQVTW